MVHTCGSQLTVAGAGSDTTKRPAASSLSLKAPDTKRISTPTSSHRARGLTHRGLVPTATLWSVQGGIIGRLVNLFLKQLCCRHQVADGAETPPCLDTLASLARLRLRDNVIHPDLADPPAMSKHILLVIVLLVLFWKAASEGGLLCVHVDKSNGLSKKAVPVFHCALS